MARGSIFFALLLALASGPARAGTPLPGYLDTSVGSGLSSPTAIAFLPDGTMLIAEKGGALKRGDGGSGVTLTTVPVCSGSEMGLLGIAIDPDYGMNGFVYLYRTKPGTPSTCSSSTRFNEVVRVQLTGSPPTYVGGSLTTLLTGIRTDNGNHDGGVLRIGPDEKLYVGVGDAGVGDNVGCPGSASNPYSQDLGALEGKVLRLNLDGSVPADNPFVGTPGAREEIFAVGFRNPFRMSFDPDTGSLWVGDVGDLALEEINIVTSGDDYGWPHCEATLPSGCADPGDVPPIYAYQHGGSCPGESAFPDSLGTSITGGDFGGAIFGSIAGDYFFGDYTGNAIYHAVVNGPRTDIVGDPTPFVTSAGGPVDVVRGPDGAIYYVSINVGQVRRVAPAGEAPTDIDNYMCYKARLAPGQAKLAAGTSVNLEDELDGSPQSFDVKREVSICNPASRGGSVVNEPTVHQEGYQIKASKGAPKFAQSNHLTVDAFANRILTITAPDSLLVPANKVPGAGGAPPYAGTAVDHYKCYKAKAAKGQPKFTPPASPVVEDQFYPSGQVFDVKKITKLCNPVSVNGSALETPASHLVCYQAKLPPGTRFTRQTVSTNNPDFGTDVLTVTGPSEICLPAATP